MLALFVSAPVVSVDDTTTADFDDNADTGVAGQESSFSMVGYFTDSSGAVVSNMPFSFTSEGVIVENAVVTISWTVTGENMNWQTFAISGSVNFYQGWETYNPHPEIESWVLNYYLRDSYAVSIGPEGRLEDGTGSVEIVFPLSLIDLSKPEKSGGTEYLARITADLDFTCLDDFGSQKSESIYKTGIFRLGWFQPSGTMTVVAVFGTDTAGNVVSFDATGGSLSPVENPAMATLLTGMMLVFVQVYASQKRRR